MISAVQIPIPSDGSTAALISAEPVNEAQVAVRNTGTVTILLGGASGGLFFPLLPNEFLGLQVASDDTLNAKVQTNGTAGQVTILTS